MKKTVTFFMLSMLLSLHGISQDKIFGKFLGSINAVKFTGSSTYKGYEKQVEIIEVSTNGQNRNTTVNFKFSPCPASADFLAHVQSGKSISKGEITVIEKPSATVGINKIKYKIYFEDAAVVSCNEGSACTNVTATTVSIKPQRVCWIYYNYDAGGKLLNSTTNGFDAKTGQIWTVTPPNF